MSIWNALNVAAWIACAVLGGLLIYDFAVTEFIIRESQGGE